MESYCPFKIWLQPFLSKDKVQITQTEALVLPLRKNISAYTPDSDDEDKIK